MPASNKRWRFCRIGDDHTLFLYRQFDPSAPAPEEFFTKPPIIRQKHSLLFRQGDYLLKLIAPQKPIDYLRKYYNSQALREKSASQRLVEIGIDTPKAYGFGYSLAPWSGWDSFLIMGWIEHFQTAANIFASEENSGRRNRILNTILDDIDRMLQYGLIHKDMHLENILIVEGDKIVWIDNDISDTTKSERTERFLKKFEKNDLFSDMEKRVIAQQLQNIRYTGRK